MSAQNHIDLLGKTGRDKITGYEGVVISIHFDLFGCVQAMLKQPVKDGKLEDGQFFDVNRIEITKHERVMPVPAFAVEPAKFGKTPESHAHGPAEKPKRTRRVL